MKKIEKMMVEAIRNRENFSLNNTRVIINDVFNTVDVYLHGNLIYVYDFKNYTEFFSMRGWNTPTTRSRLNAIFGARGSFKQKNLGAYFNGISIDECGGYKLIDCELIKKF